MDLTTILSQVMDILIVPAIVVICTAALLIAKSFTKRISKSVLAKNEMAQIESQQAIREKLLKMISDAVQSAVAANMSNAGAMKKNGKKLTDKQVKELQDSAKTLTINTLPQELFEEDSTLLSILGGKDKLDGLITSLIEKYVYEYKLQENLL